MDEIQNYIGIFYDCYAAVNRVISFGIRYGWSKSLYVVPTVFCTVPDSAKAISTRVH